LETWRSSTTQNHDTPRTWNFGLIPNVKRANAALVEFGSPYPLDPRKPEEILQLGVAPDRIDLFRRIAGVKFETAWNKRIKGKYGNARVNWVDIDSLIRIKSRIDNPRHEEDARILREVRRRKAESEKVKNKGKTKRS
jgi:hypothetical protein